jgi:hypothetical protein
MCAASDSAKLPTRYRAKPALGSPSVEWAAPQSCQTAIPKESGDAMKRRNPHWGCPRIGQQISLAFGVQIGKDVVRRILGAHHRPESSSGPTWLIFIGQTKDSLRSCGLFQCESAMLKTHRVLVVMDQFTRRIDVRRGIADGMAPCRMFQRAIQGHRLSKYLSSVHDPCTDFTNEKLIFGS